MRIVVPVKQVPETGNVRMDPDTGTMVRTGVESIVNPLDLYAVEAALRLRERLGGTVDAMTMGPPDAMRSLRECIAMGCDGGVLLSSRAFAGSDTFATSYTLAQAIRQGGEFDLIIAGERATDGDTGQVGPGIAAWLDLPVISYVSAILEAGDASLTVERLTEEGYETVRVELPAVLTVVKEVAEPRLPTLRGKQRARAAELRQLDESALPLDKTCIGLAGSPTKVVRIATPKLMRKSTLIKAGDAAECDRAAERLVAFLKSRKLV